MSRLMAPRAPATIAAALCFAACLLSATADEVPAAVTALRAGQEGDGLSGAASRRLSSPCPAGQWLDIPSNPPNGTCTLCDAGTFKPGIGDNQTDCLTCPVDSEDEPTRTTCVCVLSTATFDSTNIVCRRAVVFIDETSPSLKEGASTGLDIVLLEAPTADVTVTLTITSGATGLTFNGNAAGAFSLTFTSGNWNTPQTVTVASADDNVDSSGGTGSYTASLTVSASSADSFYNSATISPGTGITATVFEDESTTPCTRVCAPGQFAPTGVAGDEQLCLPCPQGSFCPGGDCSVTPSACAAGRYADTFGASAAGDCPTCSAGRYTAATGATACTVCSAGNQCPSTTSAGTACPAGTFSLAGADSCTPCADGFYNTGTGQTTCTECPSASFCPTTAKDSAPTACPAGRFSTSGQTACSECAPGKSCFAGAPTTAVCPAGTFADGGDTQHCIGCPIGMVCEAPGSAPTPCPAGKFSAGTAATCTACPSGRYQTSAGQGSCALCPDGSSCLDPASAPTTCPAGRYAEAGDGYCRACDYLGGQYQPATGQSTCASCPAGDECVSSQGTAAVACPAGSVSGSGVGVCTQCAIGRRVNGASTNCPLCREGRKCPSPQVGEVDCEVGTFANGDGVRTVCTPCPVGEECGSTRLNMGTACTAGRYAPVAGMSACLDCPEGHSCPNVMSATPCPEGRYSPAGDSTCTNCAAGSYCPDPASGAIACPAGTYSAAGSVACSTCPAGSSCSGTGTTACATGRYSLAGESTCTACPVGFECPTTTMPPRRCSQGYYADSTLSTTCTICTAGSFCLDPTVDPASSLCPAGTYSFQGQVACTQCPAGYQCPSTDATITAPSPCPNGRYSAAGVATCTATSPDSAPDPRVVLAASCGDGEVLTSDGRRCEPCPGGSRCPDSTTTVACAAGQISAPGQVACTPCPAGFECPFSDGQHIVPCLPGTFSPSGDSTCQTCTGDQECPTMLTATGGAAGCPRGTGQIGPDGRVRCLDCPPGFLCRAIAGDTFSLVPCTAGRYRAESEDAGREAENIADGVSQCPQCPSGFACPRPDQPPKRCPAGRFSPAGATSCTLCPAGSFCDEGATAATQCFQGSWSAAGSAVCAFCTPGYDCNSRGNTSPTGAGVLGTNLFFLAEGQDILTADANQVRCPAGTFSKPSGYRVFASSETACQPCPAGEYCLVDAGDLGTNRFVCPAGHFCPKGTSSATAHPCPAGRYNPATGSVSLHACLPCPSGSICGAGAAAVSPCAAGFLCPPYSTADTMVPCPPGKFGSATNLATEGGCSVCPAGSYCEGYGTSTATACPAGTYNPVQRATSRGACLRCDPGTVCTTTGLDAPDGACDPGHYCPPGSISPSALECPAGRYYPGTDAARAEDCTVCPPGSSCAAGATAVAACGAGYFCPEGTGDPSTLEFACPPGRFSAATSNTQASDCTECTIGSYCTGGQAAVDGPCPAGHFCPAGTGNFSVTPCAAGSFIGSTGSTVQGDCTPCTQGHYCPEGSTAPTQCPAGTFANITAVQDFNRTGAGLAGAECGVCPGGFRCTAGSIDPVACLVGEYSAPGAEACTPCLFGHFCDSTGISAEVMGRDKRCPAGLHCPTGTDHVPVSPADDCPLGNFCPEGAGAEPRDPYPVPCPPGLFANETGHPVCDPCPRGTYCLEGATDPTGLCAPGYYCPINSTRSTEEPCPGGTYMPTSGAQQVSDCLTCPAGSICPPGTSDPLLPANIAPVGYYSDAGQAIPTPCPPGRFGNVSGAAVVTDCPECDPGKYCDTAGLTTPAGDCDPGFFCTLGSPTAQPAFNGPITFLRVSPVYGDICPVGAYCPAGTDVPLACPVGTFMNETKKSSPDDCVPCTAGSFCAGASAQGVTGPCAEGYFCTGGAINATQFEAGMGQYAPEGSSLPLECDVGTFNNLTAQGSCFPCRAGEYCPSASMSDGIDCPLGQYCPAGSESPTPCPPGKYGNATRGEAEWQVCTDCDIGKYCATQGLTTPTGDCDAGYLCAAGSNVSQPEENRCPPGNYCPVGSTAAQPCPAGRYTDPRETGLESAADCHACPPGQFCLGGTAGTDGPCSAGYFCLGASDTPTPPAGATGDECPVGFICPAGSSSPDACPAGTYQNNTQQSSCITCPPGLYCPDLGTVHPLECPAGHFCLAGTQGDWVPCSNGTFNPLQGQGSPDACLACSAGRYCPSQGMTAAGPLCAEGHVCPDAAGSALGAFNPLGGNALTGDAHRCPAGFYCGVGTSDPVPCPIGRYSPALGAANISDCLFCDEGYFCNVTNMTAPAGPCDAGHFCRRGVNTSAPAYGVTSSSGQDFGGDVCPPGHYCPVGTVEPLPCAEGTFNDAEGRADPCPVCPAGYWCSFAASNFTGTSVSGPCPAGHWCPAGTSDPTAEPCPAGTFRLLQGAVAESDCQLCTAGSYCEGVGNIVPDGLCDPGYFCGNGSDSSTPSQLFGLGQGDICRPGEICPAGSENATLCPAGSFCANYSRGLTSGDGLCAAGYFCNNGSWSEAPTGQLTRYGEPMGDICPAGHYCPAGTWMPIECPAGTVAIGNGSSSLADCQACPPGSFCPTPATLTPLSQCAAGHFCPAGSTSATQVTCPPGHSCQAGDWEATPCTNGSFQALAGQSTCDVCPAGSFCPVGTIVPFPCPPGSFCPEGSWAALNHLCPAGTFSNATGLASQDQCSACPPGSFCAGAGLTEPSGDCEAGHFCLGNATVPAPNAGDCAPGFTCPLNVSDPNPDSCVGSLCPPGYYCPGGSPSALPCPRGRWSAEEGLQAVGQCSICPPGFFCSQEAQTSPITSPCTAGFFCPGGDGAATMPCPAGNRCPTGSAEPQACPLGTYMPNTQSATCDPCPAGATCGVGTVLPDACPAGFFCTGGAVVGTEEPCPPGTYQPSLNQTSSAACLACPAGQYCADSGLRAPTGPCAAGFVCSGGSQVPNPTAASGNGYVCPAGHYCPLGSSTEQACPAGTFTPPESVGGVGPVHCLPCTAGFVCPSSAQTTASQPCPAGSFCPAGTSSAASAIPCPPGHFCSGGNAVPQPCAEGTAQANSGGTACAACPAGQVCNSQGMVSGTPCPAGYFCSGGSVSGFETPCPAGTFSASTGLSSASACTVCPAGQYCDVPALTAPAGPCWAGHFCAGGAVVPNPTDGTTGDRCAAGYVCVEGSTTNSPGAGSVDGYPCPAGSFCEAGVAVQAACGPGLYQPASGQSSCLPCPAGGYCAGNSSTLEPCPDRYFCPEGSTAPTLCPPGTIGNGTGLSAAADCAPCPAGQFCVDGTPSGPCAAGYVCEGGASVPNPAGAICPEGSYCVSGTTSAVLCPAGTFRDSPGARSADECGPCPQGSLCSDNTTVPVPCSRGFYCPAGSPPVPCPLGTYNLQLSAWSMQNCTACPPGFDCNATGIGNLTSAEFGCPAGSYCPLGTGGTPIPCAEGTFRGTPGAGAPADCPACPPGFTCGPGTVVPTQCPAGFHCPLGSQLPRLCAAGTFCPPGSAAEIPCTAGFFCPTNGTHTPTPCAATFNTSAGDAAPYCPVGSQYPLVCPAGTRGISLEPSVNETGGVIAGVFTDTVTGESLTTLTAGFDVTAVGLSKDATCRPCPAGTYSAEPSSRQCLPCPAGFVCLGGTSSASPRSATAHAGYPCPRGSFCPEGSAIEQPCPVGSFNGLTGQPSNSSCLLCSPGTFNGEEGQASCRPCSASSSSRAGATTCQCEALNRIFQPSDGWCVCDAFHEFFDESFVRRSEEDGTEPCQPQVYDVCFQGEARQSDTGKCLDMDTACAGQCESGQGTYDGRTGLCDCADQTPLREICDAACQLTAPRMRLDATTGLLRMETLVSVGPTESQNVYNTTLLRMEDVPGFLTDGLVCVDGLADGLNTQDPATAERFIVTQLSEAELQAAASSNAGACTVQSVIMTEQGFTGQYGTSPRVLDTLTDAYTLPVAAFNSSGAANSSTARRLLSGDEEGPLSPLLDLDNTVRMSLALQGLLRSDTALAPSAAARYLLGLQQLPLHLAHARIAVPRSVMEALPLDAWQGAEVASLPTQSRRRRLQRPTSAAAFTDSPLVANPLMCIRLGDSVMWDLRGGDSNYPVYLKDSLLNTNPSFDYGRFRRLSTAMKSTANVTSFGYSFTEPGTYVFGNAGNPSHKLIVTVMESGSTCPTEGPIEPMRVERVNQVGARRNDDVFLEINRSMALAISLSFLVLVLALVAGFAYFHTLPWEESNLGRVTYRDKGRTSSILALHKTTAAAATQAERDASKGAASISVPAEGQESKSAPSGAAVSLEDGSNSDSDGDVVVVDDGTAHLLTATDDAAMISATKKDSQEATGQWTNVAEAVLARRSGLVGDVTRMDVADMDLVNVLESLESHQDALSAGFLDQERQARVVEKTIHSEADSIKRMLGTAAYERQMRDALYTPEDDAVRVAAAKRVMAELRRQDGFQGALAKAQSRLLDALLELTDQLKPGAVQLAEVSVDQLRADEVQLSHEDEDGARIVVDLNGDSVIGAVRDGVMKLQAAVDQCAKLVDDDRVRAAGDAPMWRLVSALGLGNARAVSSALEGARAGEENLAETLRRLMESLEPFADTAPGLQTELHATVSEFGRLLAGTTHVPSVADLIHIRARRAQHAAATAGSRRTSISSTTSQSGTRRPSLAIPQEPDFALGPELGSDDEGGMRNPLEADDGEAASGSASSPGSSRRSVSKFDVEASELIDRSEVQWLDQEEYVQEIDSSSKRVASRLRLLYTDLAHVLSMLYAQVPKMHDDCMDLLVSVRKHQASLRDELHDFVESQAGTAGDVADEDEPGLGDDDLLKYLQQLDHVLHGHVVLKDGNVASTDGIVPLKTAAALLGREQTSTSSTRQPDAGGAGEIFGADEGIEAVDSGDEDSDGETEKDSSAQSAAGSTRNAGMAAVSSAMEAVVDRESSKREDVVRKALEGVDDMEKSSRRASIADTAAEDAEGLAEAVGMTAADASRLAAVAEADAKAAADAVEADAERAREDLELELREQRLEAIERKAKQAQLGVVAEMEEEVAKAATAKADALEAERQAADAEFREEQQDMRTAMAKRQEEAAAARESRLAELRGQLAAAQTAASTGAEGALETAKAAAAAAAELEATQEREEALAEAKAAVEASSADANAELEALAAAHQARMVELEESLAAEAAAARKALTAELSEKRDQQEAELEARQQAELEAAVDAAAREALVRGHAEERASLLAQLAEEEARKASSLEARLKAAGKDTETKRAALLKQHEEEVLKVDQRASANRDKQRAKLERQLEARRNRRAVAKAKKREEEIAKAEADAAAAEARGDLEAAERIRATIRAIHGAQDAAAPADAETHAAALAAAEKAAADASASAFQREAKIASANARADQAVAEVMRGLESMRQQGEAELLSGNREKAARKEEMIAARLATQVAAAGEDSAAAAAARAKAAEDLRAHRSRLLQELEHEREVLSTKMAAAEAEAAAQVKLIRAKQADEVAALQLGFSQALGKALKGVQSEAEQKAASAQDRLADRRMARLHAIMAKAEAQRVAIQSDREKAASALASRLQAQAASAADWEADLLAKVASVSGGGVGAGGSSVAMDAVAAARAAALEAENEAERLRLAAEQAAERQRLEDEAEAAAATARQAAAEAAAAEQARLLDAKRAEQAAALARARGSAEELERIKAAQESEMAEYSAAMSANKADQLARTNAKLEARRARKRRALERKQEEERRAAEAAHGRAVAGVEAQAAAAREKEALAAVLADGSIGPDRKADAIEAVLGERHTRETAELLAAQYAERQARRKALLETLYEEKRGDIAEAVSDLRAQGASDEDIQAAEAAISDAFTQKIAAAEAELDAELSGKHSGEKIELRQRQLAEVSDAFSSLAPEDILRRHEMQAEAEEAEELASFQREMEAQKEARLAELKAEQEAEEAMWREEQEAAMRALEEEHEQLLARQQESAARQRRHAEEVAAKEEAEARAAAAQAEGASEEERERIMAAYKEDALRRATAEEDERGRQEAAMKARLAKRRAAKQAKLQAKMEAKRKAMAEAGAAKFAQAVSTVRTNMGRTMSNLAERAKRRSMASMARLVPGAPGKSALRGRRGSMGGRLSARASVAGLGSARTSARLAAAASMRQAPGSTPLAAKYAAAKVDVGALMGRVDKLEQALSAIAARPNSLFTPGAVPAGGAEGGPPGGAPLSSRSVMSARQNTESIMALMPEAVATAVMSVKKGVADFAPAREDGVLQIVHDESGSLNHRQVQHLGFARTLVTLAGMDTNSLGDEGISLLPARAFPSSMSAANTFRSQYFFDHSRRPRRLYVRTAALDRVSTLYSNMNHLLAVIQHSPEDLSQDSSPEVIATLNRHLLLAGQQLFKSMAQASGGDFEQWAAAGAPAASAGVPPTGSAARPPTAATQSLALPLSGLKNTFSKGTPSARAVAGEGLGEEFSPESMADRLAAYKAAVSHKRKV